jgi:riboflavin transporter FmnP
MEEDRFRLFFAPWVYTQGVFCFAGGSLMNELWTQITENLQFLGVCIVIVALLGWLSGQAERKLQIRQITTARRVSIIGICAAIATVLHIFDFPLLFMAPEFYKLDFSELPVMLCGFYLGPSATVACEGVKILLKLLLKGTSTAFVGDFANFAVGCSLVLQATIIYHLGKSKKSAVTGLIVGTLVLTVFGSAFNAIYLLPKFSELFGLPLETIIAMGATIHPVIADLPTFVALCVAPLNLVKGGAVSVLTLLLYKRVARPLFGGK